MYASFLFFNVYFYLNSLISILVYRDPGNRRLFFENYAKQHSFDPHNPEHWYSQPRDRILEFKVIILPNYLLALYSALSFSFGCRFRFRFRLVVVFVFGWLSFSFGCSFQCVTFASFV
jgi:hypothetical protein